MNERRTYSDHVAVAAELAQQARREPPGSYPQLGLAAVAQVHATLAVALTGVADVIDSLSISIDQVADAVARISTGARS